MPEKNLTPEQLSEGYSPKLKPAILKLVEEMNGVKQADEMIVEEISQFCSIVDKPEMKLVGVALPLSYESRGYGGYSGFEDTSSTMNDYFFTKKLAQDGEMDLLLALLGDCVESRDIMTVRTDVKGDGNYKVTVGFRVNRLEGIPDYLPENAEVLTLPACRYAKILINESKAIGRIGYEERMHADGYFIGEFREETNYVFDPSGYGFNLYDGSGDILAKYEPIRIPADDSERYASLRFKVVSLPEMKIACRILPPDAEDSVIAQYFDVQDQVFATKAAQYYLHDYYGFPIPCEDGTYKSCFGTRVSTFDGIPECVEKVTLPGGIYVHITQLEVNGDNPSIPYHAAFQHLDGLFLSSHPQYKWDHSRKVIARFRQANCASVFVPLLLSQQ